MLRDKFIHYFQQWRERQLSRGEHWLAQHLAGRSPREKGMLLAAVVFIATSCCNIVSCCSIRSLNGCAGIAGYQ